MPEETTYTRASEWGSVTFDFTVPSGKTVLMRALEMDELSDLGIIDDIDELSGTVQTEHIDRVNKKPQDRQKKKPTKAEQEKAEEEQGKNFLKSAAGKRMLSNIHTIIPLVVVKPTVRPHKDNEGNLVPYDNREPGVIYTDQIEFDDKIAIFNKAIPGKRLKSDREESSEDVGIVADESESELSTESDSSRL